MHERYEIRVQGHLRESWSEWLGGLAISHDGDDESALAGPLLDQAALHGVLTKIRDLNLTLISVRRLQRYPGSSDLGSSDPGSSETGLPTPQISKPE